MLPINILEALVDEPDSGILRVCDEIHVAIYPHFINNIRLGLINYLNRQINQWHPKLKGILVAYDSLKVHLSTAFVENEELHLDVVANFWVFRPMVGKQLKGVVLKKSDSHISCLVNGAFVVSCFKPTNIDRDVSWFGAKINQGKTVRFNVLKTDMSQQIPFIVGELVGIESEDQLENFVQVVEDKNEWEKIQSLTRKIKSQASKSGENDSDDKSARKKRKQEEMESSQDQILKQETDRKKKKNKKDKDREEEKSLLTSQKSNEDQQEQQRKEEKEKKKLAKKEKLAIGKEDEDLMQNGASSLSKNVKASNGENPVMSDVEMKAENKKKEKNEEAELEDEIERRKQLLIEKIGANINAKKKKKMKNRDEENNDNEQEPDRANSASDNAELDDEDKRQRQLLIEKIGTNINAKKKKKKKNCNEENPEDNEHCEGKKNDKKEVETEENQENAEDTEDSKEKKKVKRKVETEVNLENADGNEQESDRANSASENAELEDEVERQKQLLIDKIGTNINAKKKKKMKNSAEENPQDNERSKEKKNDKQEVEMEENLENAKDTEQSKKKKKDKRKVETKENPENSKDNEHSKEKKKGKRKIEMEENLENTDDNEQASDRANSASEKAELDDAVERQKQLLIENICANVNAKKKNEMKNRDEENPEDNEHGNNKQAIETEENPENAKDTDHTKEKKNGKRKMETEENPENAKDNEHSKEKKKGKRKVETEENPENADEQESDRANSASENADEEVNRKPKNGKGRKQKAADSQIPELPVPQFDRIESKMMKHKDMVKELGDGAPSFMVPTSTPTSNGKPSEMHQNEIVSSLIANLLKNQKTNKTKKSK